MANKLSLFFKKPVIIALIIIIAVGAAGAFLYFRVNKKSIYSFIAVQRGEVVQEVSVTGRVKPAESVDLAFEKTGRVFNVYYNVGQEVAEGQAVVALENGDILAQFRQAEASFEAANATYLQYKKGTRPEEIQAAETAVSNAERSLENAEENLTYTENKADSDLKEDYDSALAAAQKSVAVAKTSLLTLTDIQYVHFNNTTQESIILKNAKANAVLMLLGAPDAGLWTSEYISKLSGGAFGRVQDAASNPTYENIDKALSYTNTALQYVRDALNLVPVNDNLTSTEKTNLSTEKSNVNAEIINIAAKQQAISVQKATNNNNIITAQISLTTARNTLASAKDNLALKRAGYTKEQIASQKANADSAKANAENLQSQLAKTIIKAPFTGIIIKQDAKIGEVVPAQTPIVSMISESKFEVEANIPEVDIAKIKIGETAMVTLDAYGEDVVFQVKVSEIDPAETIIEDVPTYETKLQFLQKDNRIKSGMTANIDILTDKKENVLVVPNRAVTVKDGDKSVLVKINNLEVEERKVETGLRGSDGNIEILSGLKEGEEVVNFKEGE